MAEDDPRASLAALRSALDESRQENADLRRRLEELQQRIDLHAAAARLLALRGETAYGDAHVDEDEDRLQVPRPLRERGPR